VSTAPGTSLESHLAVLSVVVLAAAVQLPVPFVPQERDTCGAAALAMVMGYWGAEVPHDAIAKALVDPDVRGIRGSRLAEFAREQGMTAIAFAADRAALRDHLAKGRPLIVALDGGRGGLHDVVAVGLDEAGGQVVVHDPARGPGRRLALSKFERQWAKSGRWALLVQPLAEGRTEGTASGAGDDDAAAPGPDASPPASQTGEGYEALVAGGLAAGRAGEFARAVAALDRAIALEPTRPEAWTERGGVRFLEGRYEDAAADLRRSLALRDDAYSRELLASALHLAGHELEALAEWNALGQPTLRTVEIGGLRRTNDRVARREIGLAEGDTLTVAALRAARRRLEETGVFERVTLRPQPRGDGTAELDVALAERHGLARGPADFLVTTGVNLAWKRLRLRYSNIGGGGVSLGASYRWQENRPETALQLQWPRPFSLPATLRLAGFRGEQAYDLGGAFDMRRRGVDLGLRHVLGGGAVAGLGVRVRDRSFSDARADAPPGLLLGVEASLEVRLVETRRHRVDATGRLFAAGPALASDLGYVQADAELRYEGLLARPEGRTVERSVLAARARAGWGSGGLPVTRCTRRASARSPTCRCERTRSPARASSG
jgi:tetratricopeptide (TPR) repeat protein